MDNEHLFRALFDTKAYDVKLGNRDKQKYEKSVITYNSVNPILNNCLRYALRHLPKYRDQAVEILKFGIEHNANIAQKHDISEYYVCNELGGIKNCKDKQYYEFAIVTYEKDIQDKEINGLIERLPKFNDCRR